MLFDHGARNVDEELIAPLSKELGANITAGEEVRLNVHQHWTVLWRPLVAIAVVLLMMLIMLTDDRLPAVLVWAFLLALGWLAWSELLRRHNTVAATDKRILKVEGVFNVKVSMMRHGKVTDMRLNRPLIGRLLGFGGITVESAGQDQSIRELTFVKYPTQVYRRLNEAIFTEDISNAVVVRGERRKRARQWVEGRSRVRPPKASTAVSSEPVSPHRLPTRRSYNPFTTNGRDADTDEIPTYRQPD